MTMSRKRILLIDNYDSFTYNLADYFLQLNTDCTVTRNDDPVLEKLGVDDFDGLVLSPGPQQPKDAGRMMELIEKFYKLKPILGICLGHQGLGQFFGATLRKAKLPVHGKTSILFHKGHLLFSGLPDQFEVMRYHSLILDDFLDTPILPIAETADGEIMAITHRRLPLLGVQFHPESILTAHGLEMLQNWLRYYVID